MRKIILASVCLLVLPSFVLALSPQMQTAPSGSHVFGGAASLSKAAVDTVLLIGPHGSGAWYNGQFETPSGFAHWNEWTSIDNTVSEDDNWQVSNYHAEGLNGHGAENLAFWCGSLDYPACDAGDEEGGYGNNYREKIQWSAMVADPSQPCQVSFDCWLNFDLEPGYDFIYLKANLGDGNSVTLFERDGQEVNYHLQGSIVYNAGEYCGVDGNLVQLQFIVITDGAYSDEDCMYPSDGACQIDDILVEMDNGSVSSFTDFEDGASGDWEILDAVGVGDFAKIWMNLRDIDSCVENSTPQAAFIDDGLVVPGTGGTMCEDWCYGPGGYIVNNSGGLLGEEYSLNNMIVSPVIDISSLSTTGFILEYDVYSHMSYAVGSPSIFRIWKVRSTASETAEDIEFAPWRDLDFLYYGEGYSREKMDVSQLMENGANYVQVALGVFEVPGIWGWWDSNGTPAPYYDNVRLSTFNSSGPAITAQRRQMAQDAFPANGLLDLTNPAGCSVRFDMAAQKGDSIVADIAVLRDGAVLNGNPLLSYRLKPNHVFDPYRSSGLPSLGSTEGWAVFNESGEPIPNRFAFDLPDSGFLFPGDVLHYFISATDDLGGDCQTSHMPADTTGFSEMNDPLAYAPLFTVRALPSVESDEGVLRPKASVLFWNDSGTTGRISWHNALRNNDLIVGENCDIYYTTSPADGLNNGLGDGATPEQLSGYSTILYTSGSLNFNTMTEVDAQLMSQWLAQPEKHLFATGDNLASELNNISDVTRELLTESFGVSVSSMDIRNLIGMQFGPVVKVEGGNPVLDPNQSWVANGGCPFINTFDAVETQAGAVRLASFTNQAGNPDYTYSAATLFQNQGTVISLPYAFEYIWEDPDGLSNEFGMASRSYLLRQVLEMFGQEVPSVISGIPNVVKLQAANHPNPFNPSTTIEYVMPAAGHLRIKVFDVRGNLVRVLFDQHQEPGPGQVLWDGTADGGGEVSSGVYFYEIRARDDVLVRKMTLVK